MQMSEFEKTQRHGMIGQKSSKQLIRMLNKSFNHEMKASKTNNNNELARRIISKNDSQDVSKIFQQQNGFQTGDTTKMRPKTSNLLPGSRNQTIFHRNL